MKITEEVDIDVLRDRVCDLEKAIKRKLIQNEDKYPISLSKGNAKKYNQRDS